MAMTSFQTEIAMQVMNMAFSDPTRRITLPSAEEWATLCTDPMCTKLDLSPVWTFTIQGRIVIMLSKFKHLEMRIHFEVQHSSHYPIVPFNFVVTHIERYVEPGHTSEDGITPEFLKELCQLINYALSFDKLNDHSLRAGTVKKQLGLYMSHFDVIFPTCLEVVKTHGGDFAAQVRTLMGWNTSPSAASEKTLTPVESAALKFLTPKKTRKEEEKTESASGIKIVQANDHATIVEM